MAGKPFDTVSYVKWAQRSLNRLLEISLAVDGDDQSEPYRAAVAEFNRLFLRRNFDDVDPQTQDALILESEADPRYVKWMQSALETALGTRMEFSPGPAFRMTSAMRTMVRSFQRKQSGLKADGFVGFQTELALMTVSGMAAPGAKGTDATAIIDASGHPTAGDFYRTFPDEPILPSGTLHIATVKELTDMTVSSLLQAILDSKHENILICCHGSTKGLRVPIIEGQVELGSFAAELLAEWRDGSVPDAAVENTLKWDKWPIHRLLAFQKRLKGVGKKNLRRVELRSCNTGSDRAVLENLRHFFNCKHLTAPDILDGYAPIDPGSPTTSRKTWNDFRDKHKVRVEEGSSPDKFAIAKKRMKGNKLKFFAITESANGFRSFIKRHFVVPKSLKIGARISGHALIPPGRPVFPADSGYRAHLVKVDK